MKRFLKKRCHSIPVGIIAALLVTCLLSGAVLAVFVTTPQDVTQEIVLEYEYGTITAPAIELPNLKVGETFTKTYSDAVTVVLGPGDGKVKALRMSRDPDDLYTLFDVVITLTEKPAGSTVGLYGYGGTGVCEIDLDVEGTYVFDQTFLVTAGSNAGSANSTVHFSLVDSTTPPFPG